MEQNFGEYLKKLREGRGLSMNALAERSGVSVAHISRMERNQRTEPSPDIIRKLSSVLGHFEDMMVLVGHLPAKPGLSLARSDDPMKELDEEGWRMIAEFEDFVFKRHGWDPSKKRYGEWLEKPKKKK